MVFPRAGLPHRIDVIHSAPNGADGEDSPVYTSLPVIVGRPGIYVPKKTMNDRWVADGVNISGTVYFSYKKGDSVVNADEIVVRDREGCELFRYKAYVVHRMDLYRRTSHWQVEVVRYG